MNRQNNGNAQSVQNRVAPLALGAVALLGLGVGAYSLTKTAREQPAKSVVTTQGNAQASSQTQTATKTVTIPVEGMSCVSCAGSIKKALKAINGVVEAKISLEQRNVRVRYDSKKVSPKQLVAAINKLGYKAGNPQAS